MKNLMPQPWIFLIVSDKILDFWSKLNGFKVGGFTLPLVIVMRDYTDYTTWKKGREWVIEILNHESIHIYQQLEWTMISYILGGLFCILGSSLWLLIFLFFPSSLFFLLYGLSYLINLLMGMNHYDAYRNIPFEKEAFSNDKYFDYLENRPLFNTINYIKERQ
jgi:hypothetical protein